MLYTVAMNLNTLWTPLILVNFKAYTQAMGRKALELANMAESVSAETDVCIGLAPQYTDI